MKNSLLLIPLALSACIDPELADEEPTADELGETAQELTSSAFGNYTCSTAPSCSFNLGSATNRACFIAGVRGAAGNVGSGLGSYSAVNQVGSDYILTIFPTAGRAITITTGCVKPAANVTTTRWTTNFGVPSVEIPGTTASSRCFLNIVGGSNAGLTHYDDSIKTWKSGNKWYLGGTAVGSSYLTAGAICFDVASTQLVDTWGQGVSGSITRNLSSNAAGGVGCGLTEIGGRFTTTDNALDGVWIDYLSGSAQWIWTLKNFKHGIAACIK